VWDGKEHKHGNGERGKLGTEGKREINLFPPNPVAEYSFQSTYMPPFSIKYVIKSRVGLCFKMATSQQKTKCS